MTGSSGKNDRRCQKLALLVGSNPLPNYLAATVLAPAEVVLLYSPETQEPCDHLRTAFTAKGIRVSEVCIDDATDARKIHDACGSLQGMDHLHYSGGTKPMAARARATFTLLAPLSWLAPPDPQDCACLALAALATRHGGLARNRGRGHLRITIDGDMEQTRAMARGDGGKD
ncbi:MAG: hypothetical protein M5U22_16700 [Thermoleophilia bacterium]|nr:hypothetical protein [Thermoleophilia bacterium]